MNPQQEAHEEEIRLLHHGHEQEIRRLLKQQEEMKNQWRQDCENLQQRINDLQTELLNERLTSLTIRQAFAKVQQTIKDCSNDFKYSSK